MQTAAAPCLRAAFSRVLCVAVLAALPPVARCTASAQCARQSVPEHAYLVPPLLTGFARCEWLCYEGYVRCSAARTAGMWAADGAYVALTPGLADECFKLPRHGAVLHARVAALVREGTDAASEAGLDRGAALAHHVTISNAVAQAFPGTGPCAFWMQNAINRDAVWPRLSGVFGVRQSLMPVPRPFYRQRVANAISSVPEPEDMLNSAFVEIDVLLYTQDVSETMSVQASKLRDALALALSTTDNVELLAISVPTGAWLSLSQAAPGLETFVAGCLALGIAWVMLGVLLAVGGGAMLRRVVCRCTP